MLHNAVEVKLIFFDFYLMSRKTITILALQPQITNFVNKSPKKFLHFQNMFCLSKSGIYFISKLFFNICIIKASNEEFLLQNNEEFLLQNSNAVCQDNYWICLLIRNILHLFTFNWIFRWHISCYNLVWIHWRRHRFTKSELLLAMLKYCTSDCNGDFWI